MPIRESFRLALANLWGHKLRSFLTLLGVLISVATLVAVVSLIRGMNRYVSERVSQLGSDVFIISRFGIITNARQFVEAQKRPRLALEDYQALEQGMKEMAQVGAIVWGSGKLTVRDQTMSSSVRGVTPNKIGRAHV